MLVFELSNVFGLWSQPFDQTIQNSRQVKASLDRFVYKHIFSLYIKQSSLAKFGFQMVGLVYRHVIVYVLEWIVRKLNHLNT